VLLRRTGRWGQRASLRSSRWPGLGPVASSSLSLPAACSGGAAAGATEQQAATSNSAACLVHRHRGDSSRWSLLQLSYSDQGSGRAANVGQAIPGGEPGVARLS
jgi:hypothetical protein